MRSVLPLLICLAAPALAATEASAEAAKAAPVIGCASLANYRMLGRESPGPQAAARLADPKADHLGCAAIPPETVTAVADHIMLEGRPYDCLALRGTSVCQWVAGGSLEVAGRKAAAPSRPKR